MTNQPYQERLTEILELALKQTMAYAFDKGYTNDHKPDHARADIIRDEALAALADLITEQTRLARVDELKQLKRHSEQHISKQAIHGVHDDIEKGSTLAMVPVVHINDRLEELAPKPEKGTEHE